MSDPDERERQFLAAHARQCEQDRRFMSSLGQEERELTVVRALLRCLGVEFEPAELRKPIPDTGTDVAFREAAFQVTILLDDDRRLQDEYNARAARAKSATSIADVEVDRWPDSRPMNVFEFLGHVVRALEPKANTASKESLDALVYVNLRHRHLFPLPDHPITEVAPIAALGWRSVSAILNPFVVVLHVRPTAPPFLGAAVGTVTQASSPSGLFVD